MTKKRLRKIVGIIYVPCVTRVFIMYLLTHHLLKSGWLSSLDCAVELPKMAKTISLPFSIARVG